MDTYEAEFIARERIEHLRSEADHHRLVRALRPGHGSFRLRLADCIRRRRVHPDGATGIPSVIDLRDLVSADSRAHATDDVPVGAR